MTSTLADAFYTPRYDVADTWVEPVHLIATKSNGRQFQPFTAAFDGQNGVEPPKSIVHLIGIAGVGHFNTVGHQLIWMVPFAEVEFNVPLSIALEDHGVLAARPTVK